MGETQRWTKHVVIRVRFAKDVGSTPTASTIFGEQLHLGTARPLERCN